MEVKYYNSEKLKSTYRVINDSIVYVATTFVYSPQTGNISKDIFDKLRNEYQDFKESNENEFYQRIEEVVRLIKEYIK